MKQAKELYKALKDAIGTGTEVFPAIVKAVDKGADTCEVEMDELEIGGVRLRAAVEPGGSGVKHYPEIDSVVLVQKIGDKEEHFVTMMSEVEEVVYEIDTTVFRVKNGVRIAKGNESLRDVIVDLISAIKLITVPTNVGPSGVPLNVAAFTAIETRFKQIIQ